MRRGLRSWLYTGVLLSAAACAEDGAPLANADDEDEQKQPATATPDGSVPPSSKPTSDAAVSSKPPATKPPGTAKPATTDPVIPPPTLLASLAVAADCGDLLTRIQNDAIAKLKLQVELAKKNPQLGGPTKGPPGSAVGGLGGFAPPPQAGAPTAPVDSRDDSASEGASPKPSGPTSASDTNKQVQDVDEADFVKVVENGASIYLLHGNTLRKLKSWPAQQTQLVGKPLTIEGSPSEMFVTAQNKAVVFSAVWGYGENTGGPNPLNGWPGGPVALPCRSDGFCGGGGNSLKITVADLSGAEPKVERELYYEGSYVSSRRYEGDIVRAVVRANSKFNGLFQPSIQWYDAWGRPYDSANIASQLDEWEKRTTASIRATELSDWLPTAREAQAGKLVELAPDCDSYFVPEPGLAGYGLTHVLSLDARDSQKPVGGVTIVGAASTVYSNAQRLVLAQPDFRTLDVDFGITSEQQTALHQFDLSGAETKYVASGWVFGQLPRHNPQFGIDVTSDGTIRVASTGFVRKSPSAKPNTPQFWERTTENYVSALRVTGEQIAVVGKSAKLGHVDESVQSARFIGDRAYVVTFRQTDPLIVVDVSNPSSLPVLGEIEIPGFSQYIHPLDDLHLVTLGQSASRGIQLQLFDVTDPKNIPPPKTLDFGSGSYSEGSYNHKAFTLFEGVLAIPISGQQKLPNRPQYSSGLELVRVDAQSGFSYLGNIDHARLYANNGAGVSCGQCDANGCFEYACGYAPEVRRGHFVKGEGGTFVYSFSHAGVLVHDLASLTRPAASVGLPAPIMQNMGPWYPTPGMTPGGGGAAPTMSAPDRPPVSTPTAPSTDATVPPKP